MRIIDVSEWQGDIDFQRVKADKIDGVIIRAGYGKGHVDGWFAANICKAIAAGMHIGVYWFSYAYIECMAENEAILCDHIIRPYKDSIDLGVYFDWEYDSKKYAENNGYVVTKRYVTDLTKIFCKKIDELGYDAGFYYNYDFRDNYYYMEELPYRRWMAAWDNVQPDAYIWQYTDQGAVAGISGSVDMDKLLGEAPAPVPKKDYKTVDDIVDGVWAGDFGNDEARKDNLYNYIQDKVNERVR